MLPSLVSGPFVTHAIRSLRTGVAERGARRLDHLVAVEAHLEAVALRLDAQVVPDAVRHLAVPPRELDPPPFHDVVEAHVVLERVRAHDVVVVGECVKRRAIRERLAPLAPPPDERLLRSGLRAWIGLIEALALDWIDHRDLSRAELIALATRAIGLVVPGAAAALAAPSDPRQARGDDARAEAYASCLRKLHSPSANSTAPMASMATADGHSVARPSPRKMIP